MVDEELRKNCLSCRWEEEKVVGKGMVGEIQGYTCDGSYGDEIILTKYVFGPREREYSVFCPKMGKDF